MLLTYKMAYRAPEKYVVALPKTNIDRLEKMVPAKASGGIAGAAIVDGPQQKPYQSNRWKFGEGFGVALKAHGGKAHPSHDKILSTTAGKFHH